MSIYQHFRTHEHPFVDQVLSWVDQVEHRYTVHLSDFLNPREQQIVESLIGSTNETVQFAFFGGYETSERKRAVIAPYYEVIDQQDFEVTVLGANYPNKFVHLEHPDVLGAFMSLGIDRKKIGDIVVLEDYIQFFITSDLAAYVQLNLKQIKQAPIKLQEKSYHDIVNSKEVWIESHQTVSSLRLDILIKEIYRMSRKDATALIKANRVKVNFTDVDDPSIKLMEQDMISVRKYGRSKLIKIGSTTRKDKIKIITARLKI